MEKYDDPLFVMCLDGSGSGGGGGSGGGSGGKRNLN